VLTGKRWAVVPQEMRDYVRGLYGKAPGPMDKAIVERVLGDTQPLSPDVRPGSLVTSTYEEFAEEIGDLARTEEDVLMYALFPNEARTYLQKHREGAERAVFLMGEEVHTVKEGDSMDVNQVRELVKLVEESGVSEVIVEEGDTRVIVRRGPTGSDVLSAPPAHASVPSRPAATPDSPESAQVIDAGSQPVEPLLTWHAVIAPMVGTFYNTPSPGADPFVQVGDPVAEGQPLCILEAMKLMNEITAEEPGVIRQVCLENATPVEYGTVLFYYEPVA